MHKVPVAALALFTPTVIAAQNTFATLTSFAIVQNQTASPLHPGISEVSALDAPSAFPETSNQPAPATLPSFNAAPQTAPTSAPVSTQPRKHGLRHLLIVVGIIGVGIVLPIVLVAVADK